MNAQVVNAVLSPSSLICTIRQVNLLLSYTARSAL